jgi:acyl-CoA reductase-like NAD-dependent aldehyde dehydrogenase
MTGIFFTKVSQARPRLFVEVPLHTVAEGSQHAAALKQGPPDRHAVGPLVRQEQFERVTGYLETGRRGGEATTGGEANRRPARARLVRQADGLTG